MDFWTALKDAFGDQAVDLRGRLLTDGSYAGRSAESIRRIVVHHTAVDASRTWAAVAAYHVNGNNWPGIGYHLGIARDGGLSYLGDIGTIRYHAGRANADSIGICFAGNYMVDEPAAAMLATYARLASVVEVHLGRQVKVVGHRDVGATACPGDRLYAALFAPRAPKPGGLAPKPEGLAPKPEDLAPLPNDEPAATAEKVRWWLEECARQFEGKDAERARAILYSLIALAYRLEQDGREKE